MVDPSNGIRKPHHSPPHPPTPLPSPTPGTYLIPYSPCYHSIVIGFDINGLPPKSSLCGYLQCVGDILVDKVTHYSVGLLYKGSWTNPC